MKNKLFFAGCIVALLFLLSKLTTESDVEIRYVTGYINHNSNGIETVDDNQWDYDTDYQDGTRVVVCISDNGTPNDVTDDIITSVKKF